MKAFAYAENLVERSRYLAMPTATWRRSPRRGELAKTQIDTRPDPHAARLQTVLPCGLHPPHHDERPIVELNVTLRMYWPLAEDGLVRTT